MFKKFVLASMFVFVTMGCSPPWAAAPGQDLISKWEFVSGGPVDVPEIEFDGEYMSGRAGIGLTPYTTKGDVLILRESEYFRFGIEGNTLWIDGFTPYAPYERTHFERIEE